MNRPVLDGSLHHLALSVSDEDASAQWYERVLGCTRMATLERDQWRAVVLHTPNGMLLELMGHKSAASDPFDERRTGLDHVSFALPSAQAVDDWAAWLDEIGVDHSPVKSGALEGSKLVVFRDPDGIQLEVYSS